MNSYIHTPRTISIKDIEKRDYNLSASQYKGLIMPNENYKPLKDFLFRDLNRKDLGVEVGSLSYIDKSPYAFIRTKALQEYSYLPIITNETALPIMPGEFVQMNLKEGDLLISKDSNIGEIVILDKVYPNHMLSGAIYKLPIQDKWRYYILAIVKHEIFREQLDCMVPKGATIRHAKTMFLDCKIPLPNKNSKNTIEFVSLLTRAIINKEKLIVQRHNNIIQLIDDELRQNQKPNTFTYHLPKYNDIVSIKRLDASLYKEEFKKKIFNILNYNGGCKPLTELDLDLKPGPSLEVKLLGTRIDSQIKYDGFYRLITPKQVTNFGTIKNEEYIGTPTKIAPIQYGDIIFGESGTGRTMVFLDNDNNTINNAHAHILRTKLSNDMDRVITIRSILQYYKEIGITDCMTVGGSGGHLSPSYFDRLMIPNFPKNIQKKVSSLYYSRLDYNTKGFNLSNFLEKDCSYNCTAGIYELDRSAKHLRRLLDIAIDDIINDRDVKISFDI